MYDSYDEAYDEIRKSITEDLEGGDELTLYRVKLIFLSEDKIKTSKEYWVILDESDMDIAYIAETEYFPLYDNKAIKILSMELLQETVFECEINVKEKSFRDYLGGLK